ncbi:MAG: rhodanese-like domain-containing protein [Ectothiorhodospiraceae bacterium]|nr:rhodanese-like domain-containing protein [Ectothiorhodospiraceae bacterium]
MFGNIKEIDAPELASWVDDESQPLRVIDVREIREIQQGTMPGAEPLPLATLPLNLGNFKPDEKLVIICRSGARSAQACMFLQEQGFENVYNLRGGMIGWAHNSLPIVQPELN